MRKLQTIGLGVEGLKIFYLSNIRSIISYAAPAWYTFLSSNNKIKLEKIQRTATRIIHPDISYEDRLLLLNIPKFDDFISNTCASHFTKVARDKTHPLFSYIIFYSKVSSRSGIVYKPLKCRTSKRSNSFF